MVRSRLEPDHPAIQTLSLLLQAAAAALLAFLPRRLLEHLAAAQIRGRYYPWAKWVLFTTSGRTALLHLLRALRRERPDGVVLVPDYICNVVPRAAAETGFEVETYPLDEHFQADREQLARRIGQGGVRAVVLASILGAQNNRPRLIESLRARDAELTIVLDECQNLITGNPVRPEPGMAVIGSFNQKTIHGVMGGFIALPDNPWNLTAPALSGTEGWRHEFRMAAIHLVRTARRLLSLSGTELRRPHFGQSAFEYSACVRYPYRMAAKPAAHISLAAALLGLLQVSALERRRKLTFNVLGEWLRREQAGTIIPTERGDASPYIPLRLNPAAERSRLPIERAYALPDNPSQSLRPDIFRFLNDGLGIYHLAGLSAPEESPAPTGDHEGIR